jgi:UDP-N-acetylmuramate dehydrogenase
MNELNARRRDKQPLEQYSCGSTFKRPEGHFAAKLISDAGLKGYQVGGAAVSVKHCGFVINKDHATAKEFLTVINDVVCIVKEQFNVTLEPEVRFLGEF